MFTIVALGIGILFSSLSNNAIAQKSAYLGLNEDQALVCIKDISDKPTRGSEFCRIVDILDLLTEAQESKLFADFDENNDTFNIESLD